MDLQFTTLVTLTHSNTHTLIAETAMQGASCSSGAIWGSASSLIQTSNFPIIRGPDLPPELQPSHLINIKIDLCKYVFPAHWMCSCVFFHPKSLERRTCPSLSQTQSPLGRQRLSVCPLRVLAWPLIKRSKCSNPFSLSWTCLIPSFNSRQPPSTTCPAASW